MVDALQEDEDGTGGNPRSSAGFAYVFHRSATGWVQEQKIVSPERNAGDFFGGDVSIDSARMVMAAWSEDGDLTGAGTMSGVGDAYLFTLQGGAWIAEEKIVANDEHQ